MPCPSFVTEAISRMTLCRQAGDVVLADTHCQYPSGTMVVVAIVGDDSHAIVHDNAGAATALGEHGIEVPSIDRALEPYANARNLNVENGRILSAAVSSDWLSAAIVMVANASKEAADDLVRQQQAKQH